MLNSNAMKRNAIKRKYSDKIFDGLNLAIMLCMLVVFIWPLWFVVIASFSDPNAVWRGEVLIWPVGFNLKAYQTLLEYTEIWIGYRNTIIYTVLGTLLNLVLTICAAYPLSFKDLIGKKFFMTFLLVTMYFSGGMIPSYILNVKLGLTNTPYVMIIAGACSVYNVLVMRTFFKTSIPTALWEAAKLDGADAAQYLIKVVLPLSKPILAVIGLYYAVGHWNDYYTGLIYIRKEELLPLQNIIRNVFDQVSAIAANGGSGLSAEEYRAKRELASMLKYTTIICASAPLLMVYPFLQKFFVKGVMIGSVKE